jgi:hypothetical protein
LYAGDEPEVETKELRLLGLMTKHESMRDELARMPAALREGRGKKLSGDKLFKRILRQSKNKC